MNSEAIQKACDHVGGQTALAKILTDLTGVQITQQRVRNWVVRGDDAPVEFMAAIEKATEGSVTRRDLRPDDWYIVWPELAGTTRRTTKDRRATKGVGA